MKRAVLALISLLFIILLTSPANAGVLLEPYLGYGAGAITAKTGTGLGGAAFQGLNIGYGSTATTIGGRLGYSLSLVGVGLFGAVDYAMSTGKAAKKTDEADMALDANLENTAAWFVVGAKLVLLRVYAGVGLQSQTKLKSSESETTFTGGSGFKGGLSFTGLPLVNLNLEYITHSFGKYKSETVDQSIEAAGVFSEVKMNHVMFSVSLPLDL